MQLGTPTSQFRLRLITVMSTVCCVFTIVQVASSPATNVTAVPTTGVDAPLIVPVHVQDVPAANPAGPPDSDKE